MTTLPPIPPSPYEYTKEEGANHVCPECAHQRSADALSAVDAHGTPLANGDSVVLLKDLKVKGSSLVLKQGTKVKNIRLQEGDHDIACKVNGTALNLKSEFVKKA